MDLKQKYTGDDGVRVLSLDKSVIDFFSNTDDVSVKAMESVISDIMISKYNGEHSIAVNVDNKKFLLIEYEVVNYDELYIDSIDTIDDINRFLDYINLKKAIKWNESTEALEKY